MKFLAFVEVENFKCHHKKRRFDFGPGINLIDGPSSRGKSTLMKAIIKCLTNEPIADVEKFRSFTAPESAIVHIAVGVKDDHGGEYSFENAPVTIITRRMGKKLNGCYITYPDGSIAEYEAFGSTLPPEVAQISGVRKVNMGYESMIINYMAQLDQHFLSSRNDQDRAKAISAIGKSTIIDNIRKGINSDIIGIKSGMTEYEAEIKKNAALLMKYSDIEDRENVLIEAEALLKIADNLESLNVVASGLDKRLSSRVERILEDRESLNSLSGVPEARRILTAVEEVDAQITQAESLNDRMTIASKKRRKFQEGLSEIGDVESAVKLLVEVEPVAEALEVVRDIGNKMDRLMKRRNALRDEHADLVPAENIEQAKSIIDEIESLTDQINTAQRLLTSFSGQMNVLLKKQTVLREVEKDLASDKENLVSAIMEIDICPYCYRAMDDEARKNIEEHA